MKLKTKLLALLSVLLLSILALSGCGGNNLNEKSFFKVMTNIQNYPEQYLGETIELDCFTYEITDVESKATYTCGVRKCSASVGCTCGNDSIIGFILEADPEAETEITFPAPKNQSVDTNEKSWIHLRGKLKSEDKQSVTVYSYLNGEPTENTEKIQFLTFIVESCEIIADYSGLNYYVTK